MRRTLPMILVTLMGLLVCSPVSAASIIGFASMGASETDGKVYTGSWVPYEVNFPGWNFGGAGNPYNVAVGGATSVSLVSGGQHTAVANLVASGKVNLATLLIGGNDFNAKATQIANGTLSGATLSAFSKGVVSNIDTAMDTVLASHPLGMVVASLPDASLSPGGRAIFDTPIEQARGKAAIDQFNALLKPEVLSRGLAYIDLTTATRDLNATPLIVGGVTIDMVNASSDPIHFFQDAIHPAAVGNGLIANLMMTAVNVKYGTHYTLLTDKQILIAAGLGSSYTGETSNLNYASYISTPEPSTLTLAGIGGLAILAYARRHRLAR